MKEGIINQVSEKMTQLQAAIPSIVHCSGENTNLGPTPSTIPAGAQPTASDILTGCKKPISSTSSQPASRFLLPNARSISPAAKGETGWKLPFIEKTIINAENSSPTIAFAIKESWLKGNIIGAQVKMDKFKPYRPDRSQRRGGGSSHS